MEKPLGLTDYKIRLTSLTTVMLASLFFSCIFLNEVVATDLRPAILPVNGTESCFHYNAAQHQFEMNCNALVWGDHGYTNQDYISLDATLDGGRQNGHIIDLNGRTVLHHLIKLH
eukprot:gb/GECG01012530.1/.p1 GENE.gb/GECG01012530.1/~~gb/GECG01012530.1/.p1  ORF type:complete len:115 (+),score=7.42 gb/GECG01012530.1/:1-345(+)